MDLHTDHGRSSPRWPGVVVALVTSIVDASYRVLALAGYQLLHLRMYLNVRPRMFVGGLLGCFKSWWRSES